VRCQTSIAVAVCLCVVALGGQLSAGTIIDENFDANPLIGHAGPRVPVNMDMMGMWLYNMDAPMGMGIWRYVDDNVGHVIGMGMGMSMGMDMMMWPWYNTLVYFCEKPVGLGGEGVELSFDFLYFPADPATSMAMFGFYGWQDGGKEVLLDTATPGADGTELMGEALLPSFALPDVIQLAGGVLPASAANGWDSAGGTYLGSLDKFDYIGVTFTFGATEPSGDAVVLRLDNVRLAVIPEPASMVLATVGAAMAACIRRRRKHGRR